jgi:hypothetical protein
VKDQIYGTLAISLFLNVPLKHAHDRDNRRLLVLRMQSMSREEAIEYAATVIDMNQPLQHGALNITWTPEAHSIDTEVFARRRNKE